MTVQSDGRVSVLAGETKSRSLLGGRRSRAVVAAWFVVAGLGAVLTLFLQIVGFVIAGVLALVLVVGTMDAGGGSTPWQRWQARYRMRWRLRHGFEDFAPVESRPVDLDPMSGSSRAERRELRRQYNAYRDWPDGIEGLYWLESRPRRPAVAYHSVSGQVPYLSVAFSVDGPVKGLHGDRFVWEAQEAFGQLLSGWGASQKLVSGLQIVTRVIPSESAFHEVWLERELDPAAPAELLAEYGELLDVLSAGSFVQRHFVTVRWNVDHRWMQTALKRGPGLEGYLELVNEQIESVRRRLEDAAYTKVETLSGPRMAAVLRHMQHPDWPIDRASDADVDSCWLPSHDEWGSTEIVAQSPAPLNPELLLPQSSWLHRTAQVPVQAMEVRELDGLWQVPMLTGMEEQIVRTISTHIALVPAREAKTTARRDATSDRAEIIRQERKGRLVDDESEMALSSAVRRYGDLRDGTGQHGAVWTQFVTISARTVDELATATQYIEEAADEAGIPRLDWMDTLHSAAQAACWPLGRGMAQPHRTRAARTAERLSDTGSAPKKKTKKKNVKSEGRGE